MKSKRTYSILIGAAIFLVAGCNQTTQTNDSTGDEWDDFIAGMTLEEKVGQMTQLTLDMICVGEPYQLEEPHRLDTAKMRHVFNTLKVGSILNCGGHSYPRETWLNIMQRINEVNGRNRMDIPVLYGIDAIHGVTYTDSSTLFPQQIGLACTWDTALVRELAQLSAYETRASGIRWNFSPVLDMGRDPRWPRFWETFGEDVKLAGDMGVKMVEGYQYETGDSTFVAACLKHFLGYSVTLSGKDRTQAWISPIALREYFVPTFKRAIDAGAMSIMVNSGEIDGIPVHVNGALLTDLLRNELGFEGVIVTDWEDIKYLVSRHRVAANYKDAIVMAVEAGIDMSMVPVDTEFPVLLKELVEEGRIAESRIDESVKRILKMKKALGLFNATVPQLADYPNFASEQHRALARKAAEESLVLVQNDGTLPLAAPARILVVGEGAKSQNVLNGGWTRTWQGADTTYNTPDRNTIFEALQASGYILTYRSTEAFLNQAVPPTDLILVVCSEGTYTEKPGDIEDLRVSDMHAQAIAKAAEASTPSCLLLVQGRPRVLPPAVADMNAVLIGMLPGDEGGDAIASVLSGAVNPSGKLAFTYPRYASSHTTYDHKYTDRIDTDFSQNAFDPLYPFGHGLSYTSFTYSGLKMNRETYGMTDTLHFNVSLTNSGLRSGTEVVQVYISDSVASVTPSVARLRAYARVSLEAGETKELSFMLPLSELRFIGRDLKPTLEAGDFGLRIADRHTTFRVQ